MTPKSMVQTRQLYKGLAAVAQTFSPSSPSILVAVDQAAGMLWICMIWVTEVQTENMTEMSTFLSNKMVFL